MLVWFSEGNGHMQPEKVTLMLKKLHADEIFDDFVEIMKID